MQTETIKEIENQESEQDNQPKVNPAILLARKKATKVLNAMKRNKYFQEDNAENAIINALNSGIGRKVRRNLARKMMIRWEDFIEMEDAIVELYPDRLNVGAKRNLLERYDNEYTNHLRKIKKVRKIGITRWLRNHIILKNNKTPEEAEELAKQWLVSWGDLNPKELEKTVDDITTSEEIIETEAA